MTVRIAAPADYTCKGDSERDPINRRFCRRASALRLQNENVALKWKRSAVELRE